MIPLDRIHDNGDDTLWWVLGPWTQDSDPPVKQLDRPCDTCDGHGRSLNFWLDPCPPCDGTGRHVFEIKVECEWNTRMMNEAFPEFPKMDSPKILRVHVIPDMVLPLVAETDIINGITVPANHVILRYDGNAWASVGVSPPSPITLPPAAKPGMYAIKLEEL